MLHQTTVFELSRHNRQFHRPVIAGRLVIREIPISHDHSAAGLPTPCGSSSKGKIETAIASLSRK